MRATCDLELSWHIGIKNTQLLTLENQWGWHTESSSSLPSVFVNKVLLGHSQPFIQVLSVAAVSIQQQSVTCQA